MRSKARAYVMSLRLRTLPLSLGGVLLGSLLSASDGRFDWVVFTLVMVTAAALQILSNMANEIGDLDKGTDNERRLGPIRGTQSGVLSRREMARAMVATGGVALVSGVALVAVAFGDLLEGRSVALLVAGILVLAGLRGGSSVEVSGMPFDESRLIDLQPEPQIELQELR